LNSAPGLFVLAYHYLTQGHTDAAVGVLKQVVALKPQDTLSASLVKQLEPAASPTPEPATAAPTTPPPDITPPAGATIEGTWAASPAPDITINLTIQPGGTFNWQVTQKGQTRQFSGKATYGEGMLTLVQDKGPAMVGRIGWKDATHMSFHIIGDSPEDPGLTFSKS
jgi:hypothetical protein